MGWHHIRVHVVHDPERARQNNAQEHDSEDGGEQSPAAFNFGVHVQEVVHMHQDLGGSKNADHGDGDIAAFKHIAHDHSKRDGREDD